MMPPSFGQTETSAQEGTADSDSDGIPDALDPDSDGDSVPDAQEGTADSDNDHVSREGTTTPQVTDSTLLHTRHTDGKGRSGGGGGSGARAEQRLPGRSLLRRSVPERAICAGSRVRPGGKAQASPWWRRRETRRRPAVAETRAFCTRRGER
uniref:Uncharacterized protein n=1 Tax=Emiliania huxleyi TaxID=2903 RepID=A0A7S3WHK2_EMIHU